MSSGSVNAFGAESKLIAGEFWAVTAVAKAVAPQSARANVMRVFMVRLLQRPALGRTGVGCRMYFCTRHDSISPRITSFGLRQSSMCTTSNPGKIPPGFQVVHMLDCRNPNEVILGEIEHVDHL